MTRRGERRPASLSAEEREAFRDAVRDVRPLPAACPPPRPSPPLPDPRQSRMDEAAALTEALADRWDPDVLETGEELLYVRPGLQRQLLRRLRRGDFAIRGSLDLHGLTVAEAHQALGAFLGEARARGWRCLRIIHGKGLGSPGGQPILKGRVANWLVRREEVLAFAQAPHREGGAGAVLVLLGGKGMRS